MTHIHSPNIFYITNRISNKYDRKSNMFNIKQLYRLKMFRNKKKGFYSFFIVKKEYNKIKIKECLHPYVKYVEINMFHPLKNNFIIKKYLYLFLSIHQNREFTKTRD